MRTLRGETVDRPAVSFYEIDGITQTPDNPDPFNIFNDPSWKPLLTLAREKTDLMVMCSPACRKADGTHAGMLAPGIMTTETSTVENRRTSIGTIRTSARTLTQRHVRDADINTTWTTEHLIKDADDLRAWIDLPEDFADYTVDPTRVLGIEEQIGDGGIVMLGTADPICIVCGMMDMANYTMVAFTEPDLFERALDKAMRYLLLRVKRISEALPGRLWRIVGPEYASVPYLPPQLFRRFVTGYDRKLVDAIYQCGGYARIHSHGNLKDILDAIIDTGCMGLDPIEPPPQGDVSLDYVRRHYGNDLVLFGNLEASDLENLAAAEFREKVLRALDEGTRGSGRGVVLMPSACPYGRKLSATAMKNYEVMIECVEAM